MWAVVVDDTVLVLADTDGNTGRAAAGRAWDLADVSMLMPFPASADLALMLQPSTKGAKGELVPRAWLDTIPTPLAVNVDHATTIAQLRVVAIRIDPCFRATASAPCRHQVRMSWQPFVERGGKLSSIDAAAHTFYELTPDDFGALADRLWKLREPGAAAIAGAPLDVHPLLKQQGLGGAYWTGLKAALLDYCGEESLSRLTVMQLGGRTNVWVFTGVDGKGRKPIQIARIDSPIQTIGVHAQPPTQFDGGLYKAVVSPTDHLEPPQQPELNKFLRATSGLDVRRESAMLVKVLDQIRFLEVPSPESTSETIDCASCHITQAARVWIGKYAPDVKPTLPDYVNAAGFNLENKSPLAGLTNQLRAFGYIQQSAVISQRTIYESAEVAAAMRKR